MSFTSDLRQAFRTVQSNPGFSIIAIVMLALGIGACTAIFTVVNAVLLRPLPFVDSARLVRLYELSNKGTQMNVPEANFVDWKSNSRSFETMAMYNSNISPLLVGDQAVRARVSLIGEGFFDVFKVQPVMGRISKDTVAVSHGFWQRVLGGRGLDRQEIRVLNQTMTIGAVMPADFDFPTGVEIWVPRETQGSFNPSRSAHNWSVIARIKTDSNTASASKDIGAISTNIHQQYTDVTAVDAVAVPLQQQITQSVRVALPILLGAVGILLLVACANVTNLLLAHITGRNRELAIRTALGANSTAIARLFLAQSLTLTAVGGGLGVLLSQFAVQGLLALSDGTLPRMSEIRPDGWVMSFAVLVSLTVGVILGLVPAFRSGRMNLDETLKQSGRSQSQGSAHRTTRSALVVAQVAMTIVLLVAAGLLGKSFVRVLQVQLGFQTESRIAFEMLGPQGSGAEGRQRLAGQMEQLLGQISSISGVTMLGAINQMPLSGRSSNGRFLIEGGKDSGTYWPNYRVTTPGYLEAMGIPLVRGRTFNPSDGATTPEVAVISQSVANNVWPGEDPIGKRINFGNMDGDPKYMTIVGVVGDVRNAPESPAGGEIYVHYLQRGYLGSLTLVVRTTRTLDNILPEISAQIRGAVPEASVRAQTLSQMFSSNLTNRRFNFALLAVFGGSALVLALLGVYGVTSYSVAQRKHEIGIRMALGARGSDVTRLFVGEGSRLVFLGVIIGVLASMGASRVLASMLYSVQTMDAAAYLLAIVPLFLAALLANHLPARRAARIDPVITIQQDKA